MVCVRISRFLGSVADATDCCIWLQPEAWLEDLRVVLRAMRIDGKESVIVSAATGKGDIWIWQW